MDRAGAKKHDLGDPAGAGKFADTRGGLVLKNAKKSTRMEPWTFGQVSISNWAEWMQKQEEVLGALIVSINVSVSVNFANES